MTVPTELTELLPTDVGRRPGGDVRTGSKGTDSLTRLVEQLLAPGAIRMDAQPIVGLADGTILGFELLARSAIPCSSGPISGSSTPRTSGSAPSSSWRASRRPAIAARLRATSASSSI